MAITDIPAPPAKTTTDGALQIRRKLVSAVDAIERELADIRRIITIYGRTELQAELGDDAADLAALYGALKNAAETGGKTIPAIPS